MHSLACSYITAFMGSSVPPMVFHTCISMLVQSIQLYIRTAVRSCNHPYTCALKRTCIHSYARTYIRAFIRISRFAFMHSRIRAIWFLWFIRVFVRACVHSCMLEAGRNRLGQSGEVEPEARSKSRAYSCTNVRMPVGTNVQMYTRICERITTESNRTN